MSQEQQIIQSTSNQVKEEADNNTSMSNNNIINKYENLEQQQLKESQIEQIDNQFNNEQDDIEQNCNTETLQQIDKLQNVMNKALQIVGLYKNEIDDLRSKIGDMKVIILQRDEEDKQRVVPIINQLSQIYREEFSKLMDENKILEQELVVAIQEKQEVVTQIYSCVDKIQVLEQSVFKGEIPPYLKKKLEEQRLKQKYILKSLEEQTGEKEILEVSNIQQS